MNYTTNINKRALRFFKKNTRSIEVIFMNKNKKIFFPLNVTCQYLKKEVKEEFLETVNRDTPINKLSGMMNESNIILDSMIQNNKMNKSPIIKNFMNINR